MQKLATKLGSVAATWLVIDTLIYWALSHHACRSIFGGVSYDGDDGGAVGGGGGGGGGGDDARRLVPDPSDPDMDPDDANEKGACWSLAYTLWSAALLSSAAHTTVTRSGSEARPSHRRARHL